MPNTSFDDALREVYAMAPNDRVPLNTLEISHPALPEPIYMVQDRVGHNLRLEKTIATDSDLLWDSETAMYWEVGPEVYFEPVPFRFIPPAVGDNGIQEMSIAIDNVDRRIGDFFDAIETLVAPVKVAFRIYSSDDPSGPRNSPPLTLNLTDIRVNAFEITGRATFTSIVNAKYPKEFYDRETFGGLS